MDYDQYISFLDPDLGQSGLPQTILPPSFPSSEIASSEEEEVVLPATPLLPTSMNKKYTLLEKLGNGSFGTVYKAVDSNGYLVAIKTILSNQYSRESDEVQSLKELSMYPGCNRYIVCYHESFLEDKTLYIVMEYITGENLAEILAKTLLSTEQRLSIAKQLLFGLSVIHNRSYAHRDIKPQNIMISDDWKLKYVDFGLSCKQSCIDRVGTVLYNPPEYYNGTSDASLAAAQAHDVWSLGIVFYNIVLGLKAFPFMLYKDRAEMAEEISREAPSFSYRFLQQGGLLKDLTQEMLNPDWRARPLVDDLIYRFLVEK